MGYYRKIWPKETMTPKLYMLESHAINFLKNWGAGFVMYGEQGTGMPT